MQLNNLVIISIPHPTQTPLTNIEIYPLSPSRSLNNQSVLKDDISWKKSISAFKKFKGKKDKETKTPKHSQPNITFLQQQSPNPTLNNHFSLVDNDIKFSLLSNQDYDLIQIHDNFDYLDPNTAPFFEYGITYNFHPQNTKLQHTEELPESLKLNKKTSTAPKLRKQLSKKEKPKSQNHDQQNNLKTQKNHSLQNLIHIETDQASDPFIIIKAQQTRPKQPSQCQSREDPKKHEQIKKTKSIRKKTKYVSLSQGIYARDIYSRPRSEELIESDSESSDNKSMEYGNDELPLIEFDFGMPMMSSRQPQCENGFDNLPTYEAKESSHVRARIRPFIHSNQILQEYQFNQEFIPKQVMILPNEEMELKNEEALEKA